MPVPSGTWGTKPVFITYRSVATGLLEAGSWSASNTLRVVNLLADGTYVVFRAGVVAAGSLNTTEGSPSVQFNAPVLDDPDITPQGGEIDLTVTFASGGTEMVRFAPHGLWSSLGTDLANPNPSNTSTSVCGLAVTGLAVCGA